VAAGPNVFLNLPFEANGTYRNLLVAYVAGLCGLGFRPRSVLEVPQNQYRLDRLREIIGRCPTSVHDLSRVQATKGCPRFNMPFELGLVAARRRAEWFVFEAEPFRLQKTLSDVNGHDPLIHRGKATVVLSKLRDIFGNRRRRTTQHELEALLKDVMKLAKLIERDHGSLLGRQAFVDLVIGAQRIAKTRGLI
jgi:hypothetical protein